MIAIKFKPVFRSVTAHWDKMYAEELDFLAKSLFMQVKAIEEVIT